MLLALWLENITADTYNNISITCQIQLKKLVRYKWNGNYKYVFTERLNATAERIYTYVTQDVITNGKVHKAVTMLNGMIRTPGREMEIKTTEFKDGIIGR